MAFFLRLPPSASVSRKITSTCLLGLNKSSASIFPQMHQRSLCSISAMNGFRGQGVCAMQKPNVSKISVFGMNRGLKVNTTQSMFARTFSNLPNVYQASPIFVRNSIFGTQSHIASLSFIPLWRYYSSDSKGKGNQQGMSQRNKSVMMYMVALFIFAIGVTYAAVPLYAVFCQVSIFNRDGWHQIIFEKLWITFSFEVSLWNLRCYCWAAIIYLQEGGSQWKMSPRTALTY